MELEEAITMMAGYGWKFFKTCNCDNTPNFVFTLGELWECRLKPKMGRFSLSYCDSRKAGGRLDSLEEHLNRLSLNKGKGK